MLVQSGAIADLVLVANSEMLNVIGDSDEMKSLATLYDQVGDNTLFFTYFGNCYKIGKYQIKVPKYIGAYVSVRRILKFLL